MRITGGEFGGRILKVPKSDAIRPTQDRVREALFNIIQFEVPGADFLDLFAGSGAVGIEALSRGAKSATFVEQDRRHMPVLLENLRLVSPRGSSQPTNLSTFQPFNFSTVLADVYRWIASYSGPGFSIAFADPPYALGEERGYLAPPRCGVKKKASGDCRRPFSHLTATRVTRLSDWLRSGFRRAWNPGT